MKIEDLIELPPVKGVFGKTAGNLKGLSLAMAVQSLCARHPGLKLLICADSLDMRRLQSELASLECPDEIKLFPDYETLPYDTLYPHQDIISARLELLSTLPYLKRGLIITTMNALMMRLCPVDYIAAHSFILKQGDVRNLPALRTALVSQGYLQVDQVLEHGEFAVRGSILDIFPMGSSDPYRIDFFDDEVDSISIIDPETQRSKERIKEIRLLPAHEYPLDEEGIAAFRSNYRDAFVQANLKNHTIYQAVSKGAVPAGIEYYLPLFFGKSSTLFDYLPENTLIIQAGDCRAAAQALDVEIHQRAARLQGNLDHPPLPAYTIFQSPDEYAAEIKEHEGLTLLAQKLTDEQCQKRGQKNFETEDIPEIAFDHKVKDSARRFVDYISGFIHSGGRVLLCAVSEGRRHALREILPRELTDLFGIKAASSVQAFLDDSAPLMLTVSPAQTGVVLKKAKIALITETEILGFQVIKQRQRSRRQALSQDAMIKNLVELTEGQVVVHIDHGIGLYRGLKVMTIGGVKGEYLTIEYQNGDMLNIPITALNKVARYSGAENPQLSKLGSDTWGRKKSKAAQKVYDVAAQLLDLYARRESREGTKFTINEAELDAFASGFGYEETPDQAAAIAATLNDMQQGKPMDRLVCGDVGFGKTEVALRAAFVAADNARQVAVLVPTTILAEQHYQNFKERFAGTPVTVEMLSRFKSVKEQNAVIKELERGTIDIIIGTHKLLAKNIKFKNLGLVIIDEEHRFGVKQKERLKELCAQVDLLTLTATPIPRTLNMAMEGMRDLSIIATAPEHRLAVKTFILENNDDLVREAIMRELRRGGQVYYLHNDLATINQRAEQLEKLVPEAKIDIGHGQMGERELQRVMRDFYHQRFNLLLCSTIIENGLDIPSANTIIIDRADKLGLAQLHQLRGRVGRSHHQAYAYLFTPPKALITKDAQRRLEALEALDELGAGFVLATHDLEIRGAGELLGVEQSGQIESVGFSLYMEMLSQAVKALKEGREPSLAEITLNECDINLHLPALFPDDYIGDIGTRLSLYKRLAACSTPEAFEDLKVELIDRFGFLPEASENLFALTKLKQLAGELGIRRIAGDGQGGIIEFGQNHKVDPSYLVQLVSTCKHQEYSLSGASTLRYKLPETEAMPRLELMRRLLLALRAHSTLAKPAPLPENAGKKQ
ncbi:MAG: transcription-repair coupling factor [Proteobacteria bacterium]|uniref:Transcription-repair-coupling factor n=1 Tax=Candidatus Avisuccinivibrio stercorigallinarum TaxID=2840704 RepID=A0A9D9D8N5_9GAMM|nr:transcription-repair coupling factor [Candidatus Avisuccinivibrio stercorigallinarum]